MSDVLEWDAAAANNNDVPPDGFPEGQAPSTVNDAAREVMAAIKRYVEDTAGANTAGGSSNAFTLAASQTISAYAAGQMFAFVANHTIDGSATLNIDSVGAKTLKKHHDQNLESGDIKEHQIVIVAYQANDDVFELINTISRPAHPKGAIVGINTQTGTTYNTAASDAGKLIDCDNGSAITVTIDKNEFAVNDVFYIRQKGNGQVTVEAGTNVTLNVPSTFDNKTLEQFAILTVICVDDTTDANVFTLAGIMASA